jgi:hypothetical protein
MLIYVLSTDDFDSSGMIHGVFSTLEKAEAALKMLSGSDHISPADLQVDFFELDILNMPTGAMPECEHIPV